MSNPHSSTREYALARMTELFNSPMAVPSGDGQYFYRWILRRPLGVSVYITLTSPERSDAAQVLISDPLQRVEPVATVTMRSREDVDTTVEQIIRQWKGT